MTRAARPLADAVFVETDHDGGAVGGLFETRGDNAHHAGVPAIARRPDQRRVETALFGLQQSLIAHRILDLAAFCG